ncbi:MAG TPA: hypothetical protein DIU14_05095 [Actinobacteria bacterium]|nr:hypothetical protein [Actinomycetota bacterium]
MILVSSVILVPPRTMAARRLVTDGAAGVVVVRRGASGRAFGQLSVVGLGVRTRCARESGVRD